MNKVSVIVAIVCFCISSCKSQNGGSIWTKDYEKERFNEIYEGSKNVLQDSNQRKLLAQYTVKKLKSKLPDGVASISPDSLQKLIVTIIVEYVKTQDTDKLQMVVPWTLSGENTLKISLLNIPLINKMDKKLRNNYCDCMIQKMKAANPNSMAFPTDSVLVKLIGECNVKIIGSK